MFFLQNECTVAIHSNKKKPLRDGFFLLTIHDLVKIYILGLSNVEDMLLENHLGHCVFHEVQSRQTKKAKEEIIKVYKLKRK